MTDETVKQPDVMKWRIMSAVWMTLIFALSSALFAPKMSFDATLDFFGMLNYFVRKCAHGGEFGVLTFLVFRGLHPSPYAVDRARLWAALVALLYAVSDEFHQSFVPLRSGKASDVLFDAAGILIVFYLIGFVNRSASDAYRVRFLGFHPGRTEDNRST